MRSHCSTPGPELGGQPTLQELAVVKGAELIGRNKLQIDTCQPCDRAIKEARRHVRKVSFTPDMQHWYTQPLGQLRDCDRQNAGLVALRAR